MNKKQAINGLSGQLEVETRAAKRTQKMFCSCQNTYEQEIVVFRVSPNDFAPLTKKKRALEYSSYELVETEMEMLASIAGTTEDLERQTDALAKMINHRIDQELRKNTEEINDEIFEDAFPYEARKGGTLSRLEWTEKYSAVTGAFLREFRLEIAEKSLRDAENAANSRKFWKEIMEAGNE